MEHVGKYAYKKRGFFSGLVGVIEKAKEGSNVKYYLLYKDGTKNGFNKIEDVVIYKGEVNE